MGAFRSNVSPSTREMPCVVSEGSGFAVPRIKNGNGFTRHTLTVFDYRFRV